MPRRVRYDELPKKKMTDKDIVGIIKPKKKEPKNFFALLFSQWRAWALLIAFLLIVVFAIINSSQDNETVNQPKANEPKATEPEQHSSTEQVQLNATTVQLNANAAVDKIYDLIVLVVVVAVLGGIIGAIIKVMSVKL
jgi:uncharacterized integral membrane protein